MPAALKCVESFVVARVPVTYISAADEVRMSWLSSLQKQDRLLMRRRPIGAEQQAFMWLIIFATPVIRQLVVKNTGLVEDLF
jgi:hypothetical protein